jgi:translation initiation factor 5A
MGLVAVSKPVDVGSLKIGQYVIIDDEPCRIVEFEKSKPGKHGAAKARIVGISLFTGQKKSIISPVDAKVNVPMIEKRTAQVISVSGDSVQLMDMESYLTFETTMPEDEELKSRMAPGIEVEYWSMLNRTKIMRIK